MSRIIEVGAILLAGAIILPAIKIVLDVLSDDIVSGLPGITTFEETVIDLFPIALLVAIIFAAVVVLKGKKKKEED